MTRNQTALVLVLALGGAAAGVMFVQSSSRAEARALPESSPVAELEIEPGTYTPVAPPAAPTAPLGETPVAEDVASEPAYDPEEEVLELPAPTVFPHRIDEVPMTEWRAEQLAALDPQDRELLDYKLGVLGDLRDCFAQHHADLPAAEGDIQLFFHYSVDPATGAAQGSSIDILDSEVPEEVDEAFLACANEAHSGRAFPSDHFNAGQTAFHWATSVAFPLEHDTAYLFFAR